MLYWREEFGLGMKIVTPEDGYVIYQNLFGTLMRSGAEIVLWQTQVGAPRVVCAAKLSKHESKNLRFVSLFDPFPFVEGMVNGWIESESVLFKAERGEQGGMMLATSIPGELKFLEGPELSVIKGSGAFPESWSWTVKSQRAQTPEEEAAYSGVREAPRLKAKGDKKIVVRAPQRPNDPATSYRLFDLSRGGMAFLVESEGLYVRGDLIELIEVDGKPLEEMVKGQVMSVRPVEGTSGLKVGVKFDKETDEA